MLENAADPGADLAVDGGMQNLRVRPASRIKHSFAERVATTTLALTLYRLAREEFAVTPLLSSNGSKRGEQTDVLRLRTSVTVLPQ